MQRDYKNRARNRYIAAKKQSSVPWWKWLLVILLISLFAGLLYFLKSAPSETGQQQITLLLPQPGQRKTVNKKPEKKQVPVKKTGISPPKFDFYTILPEKEVVVPEHEIKTRVREERIGKGKSTQYMMQVGSFRSHQDADKLKARLALMGIESRIEKATVGNTAWNRVKLGPFTKMASVNKIRSRLRQNKIDVVVMEIN